MERLDDHERRIRALEDNLRALMKAMEGSAVAKAAPPAASPATTPSLAGVPTAGAEIARLREELQQLRSQLEAARRHGADLERQLSEQKRAAEGEVNAALQLGEGAQRDRDAALARLAELEARLTNMAQTPWETVVGHVRHQARQAAGALCDQIWARKLEPRRVQVEAERERLAQMEPILAQLRDALQGLRPKAADLLDPIVATVVALKNGAAGSREMLQQLTARRFEAVLPEPDLPAPDWDPEAVFTLSAGSIGRVTLSAAVQAWEQRVAAALDRYLQQSLREVENAAAALDQHLGKGPALQVQDRVMSIYTMLYQAQVQISAGAAGKAAPTFEALEPLARALLEAIGLTVIMPQVGRSFDVYLQDFLDYDPASDLPADTVSRVVEPGYKKDGKPLVKAKVMVSGKRA